MAYQKRSKSEAFFTIYSDDLLVGYLVIDKGFSQHAPFAKRYELELKYLMIDQRFQNLKSFPLSHTCRAGTKCG